MKNQYFGDVNDYVKYSLLRCFAEAGVGVGVCWMLTPDDGGADGRKRAYLSQPAKWGRHDPDVYRVLRGVTDEQREISIIKREELIPGAVFCNEVVSDGASDRSAWFAKARTALAAADLWFFDPDTGIEIPSKRPGHRNSSRYVMWAELQAAWAEGKSLLVFQHFPRVRRESFCRSLLTEAQQKLPDAHLTALLTPNVLYLLAHQPQHADQVQEALRLISERWSGRVSIHSPAPAFARNIEVKARVEDLPALLKQVRKVADSGPFEIQQDDTFFHCPNGRLKLRELSPTRGELIFYQRPDTAGPKESRYIITPTDDPASLRETLSQALGVVGRVRKNRRLFLSGNTRIHLDEVENLGNFVEIEVVWGKDEPSGSGQATALKIMQRLGIREEDLVYGAYVDMVSAAADATAPPRS